VYVAPAEPTTDVITLRQARARPVPLPAHGNVPLNAGVVPAAAGFVRLAEHVAYFHALSIHIRDADQRHQAVHVLQ
jgi:hypothetical protein